MLYAAHSLRIPVPWSRVAARVEEQRPGGIPQRGSRRAAVSRGPAAALKKKAEASQRMLRGEEALPEEDLSANSLFKPLPQPSRLESLLIAIQMQAYCQQVNQFTGQSFAKLFLMQSVNAGGE